MILHRRPRVTQSIVLEPTTISGSVPPLVVYLLRLLGHFAHSPVPNFCGIITSFLICTNGSKMANFVCLFVCF